MATSDIESITPDASSTNSTMTPSTPLPPALGPGEVLKSSGKFPKPTKIPGKNYYKDEVVIRNSDSGKDSPRPAEIIRPLIIKSPITMNTVRYLYPPHFFRPCYPQHWSPPRPGCYVNPGAKERLVQITGPSEDKIVYARQLMEETIRRNASPVREHSERGHFGGSSSSLNSSASDTDGHLNQSGSRRSALLHSFSTNDASLGEYKYTVTLGHDTVKITGTNHETVRNARLVLEEYYNTWLQKNCMGDCYGLDEDVFMDPLVQDMNMLRLNSMDSGMMDPGFGFPTYTERRPVLGRTDSLPVSMPSPPPTPGICRKYSRDFLLECALSHHSRVTPPNWNQVIQECPAIVKKVSPHPLYFGSDHCLPPPYSWPYMTNPYAYPI